MRLKPGMTVGELIQEMRKAGCLGAGQLASAVSIYEEMIREGATVFFGLSGTLVASGSRGLIATMIKRGLVHAVVSTGDGVARDLLEALKAQHHEENVSKFLLSVLKEVRGQRPIGTRELLAETIKHLPDESSFLYAAYERGVPVVAITTQDLGLGKAELAELRRRGVMIDALEDLSDLLSLLTEAKRVGAVIAGGEVLRSVMLKISSSARRRLDYVIQISLDRLDLGKPAEAAFGDAKTAQVVGDATICLPIIVAAVSERLEGE